MQIEDFTDSQTLHARMDAEWASRPEQYPSKTISAGIIGNPCDAFLELTLRSFPDNWLPPETLRTFRLGHLLEKEIIADLLAAKVRLSVKASDGKQHTFTDYHGHVKAKIDGFIENDDGSLSILEIKTMNRRSFEDFVRKGISVSHPKYRAQVVMEMGMTRAKRAAIVAFCKDDSRYWSEWIEFDQFEYEAQKHRIETVLSGQASRLTKSPSTYPCTLCSKSEACWSSKLPAAASCRQCRHARPHTNESWWCSARSEPAVKTCERFEAYVPKERT